MSAALVAQTIQLIIAPVVMVSACGIILSGLLSRYASINDRLRTMAHERWELIRAASAEQAQPGDVDPFVAERLQEIDIQIPQLLQRHHLLRNAVLLLYVAASVYILCMFLIATGALLDVLVLPSVTLAVFLLADCFFLLGVLQTAVEVYRSHRALYYEAQRVLTLSRPDRR